MIEQAASDGDKAPLSASNNDLPIVEVNEALGTMHVFAFTESQPHVSRNNPTVQ